MSNTKKPRTIKFISIHEIELTGSTDSRCINFVGVTKNNKYYKISLRVDDWDLNRFVELQMQQMKSIEEQAVQRLKFMRKTHNYNTIQPVITYTVPQT